MKIKITKCSNKDFWYTNNIGETYDILITDYTTKQYTVKQGFFFWQGKSVGFEDCEIKFTNNLYLGK